MLVAAGVAATLGLYLAAGRTSARPVTVVLQSVASPIAASAATARQPSRPVFTSTPAAASAAPRSTRAAGRPSDAELIPPGGAIAQRLDIAAAAPAGGAIVVTGSAPGAGGCARQFLLVYVERDGAWAPVFDGAVAPDQTPLLPAAPAAGSGCPPAAALVLKAGPPGAARAAFAAGMPNPNGSARLMALAWEGAGANDAPAVTFDATTSGPGSVQETADGTGLELDQDAPAPPGGPSAGPTGVWARLARLEMDGAAITQRVVPNCDRGRLAAGSAAALAGAIAGQPGVIAITCSSGKQTSAVVDAGTLLDALGAPASSLRDQDYVELLYADASLAPPVSSAADPPAPYTVLISDAAAVSRYLRPVVPAPAPRATRAPYQPYAPRSSSSGSNSTSRSSGAGGSSGSRSGATGGAGGSSAAGGASQPRSAASSGSGAQPQPPANPVPTNAVPINPNRSKPPVQPPAAPHGVPGAVPAAP